MKELDDFLAQILPRQTEAEKALHNGDPTPRLEMWSTKDPVTLLGAWGPTKIGSAPLIRALPPNNRDS